MRVDGAVNTEEAWILVQNAGNAVVNGYYQPDGKFNGANKYVRRGVVWNGEFHNFYLARVKMQGEDRFAWFTSVCPNQENLGTDADIDFYRSQKVDSPQFLPDELVWYAVGAGILPLPNFSLINICSEKLMKIELLSKRIENVPKTATWALRLRGALGQYIASKLDDFEDTSVVDVEFQKLTFHECIVQLELALWKKATKAEAQPQSFTDYLDFKLWDSKGWKNHKAKSRRSPLIQVTLQHIVPYLDKPWLDQIGYSVLDGVENDS